MLGSITTKSIRDHWTTVLLAGVGIGLLFLMSMAVYQQVDVSFYYELPAAMLEAMGISEALGGVTGIAYGALFNFMGAMVLAGVAVSIGASAIAGEERVGTLDLLLSNPRSRGRVTAAKIAALLALVVGGGVLYLIAALVVPAVLGVDRGGVHVVALVVHLAANALVYGLIAMAVGAWTGSRGAAVGAGAGLLVASWLGSTLLPLFDGAQDLARVFPWHYFSGSQPEINGLDGGDLVVQLGLAAVLAVVALVGVRRRDLRGASTGVSLVDRLRANPRTKVIADRLAGTVRVSGITSKTMSDHQTMLLTILAITLYGGLLQVPMYLLLPDTISQAFADFPDALLAAIGGVDLSTPSGWIQGEFLASIYPIAAITLFASMGSRALAGEEEGHTLDLLLASPLPRRRIVVAKVLAMLGFAGLVAVTTFVALVVGTRVAGFDLAVEGLAAASVLGVLLSLVFGGVALVVGAATGRARTGSAVAAGLAVVAFVVNAFLPLADNLAGYARLSPFHYFLSSDPLANGMAWGHAAVLAAIAALLVAASVLVFDRRDLRA